MPTNSANSTKGKIFGSTKLIAMDNDVKKLLETKCNFISISVCLRLYILDVIFISEYLNARSGFSKESTSVLPIFGLRCADSLGEL